MTELTRSQVLEFIGVYHADGGPIGEAKYLIGKLLGTSHCSLCDITHSPVRRKPAWDAMVAGLGTPFPLVHLNEMSPHVASTVGESGSPVVLAPLSARVLPVALGPEELAGLGGSVADLDRALRASVQRNGWSLRRV